MIMRGNLKGLSLNWQSRRPEITLEVSGKPEEIEKYRDKDLSVEIKRYREKRSLEANAYYWVLCSKLSAVIGQSMSWVHNDMMRKYGQIEIIGDKAIYLVIPDTEEAEQKVYEAETYHLKPTAQIKQGKDGRMYRTYLLLRGSHTFNTHEMSILIDGIVEECKALGIETAAPEELERMMALYAKHHAD